MTRLGQNAVTGLIRLEIDLPAHPEEIAFRLESAGAVRDRTSEFGMLPIEVHFDVLVQVPIETGIDRLHVFRPEGFDVAEFLQTGY